MNWSGRRRRQSDDGSGGGEAGGFAESEAQDVRLLGAEGQADAEFLGTLGDGVGDDAEYSDRGEGQGDPAKIASRVRLNFCGAVEGR